MKNIRLLFLLVVFTGIGLQEAAAQPRHPRAARIRHADKVMARRVIRRTTVVILAAQKKVKENKVYTGNLARAIAHQRFARRLYLRGNFARAIHQSRRARALALLALKANNGSETADMKYDAEDQKVLDDNPPSDTDLDNELEKEMSGYSVKDEDFIDGTINDIDLTDTE